MKKLIVLLAFSIASVQGWAQDTARTVFHDSDSVYLWVAEKQTFNGDYYKFISENIEYPLSAKNKRIEGRVFIDFIIEKNGTISHIETHVGLNDACDDEAKRVIAFPRTPHATS